MLDADNLNRSASMIRSFFALASLLTLGVCGLSAFQGQQVKSGPQPGDTIPGAFQPLNVNGPFAGRYHCLVTDFRLSPVAMVFVRVQPDGVDPEVKKLLEALDKSVQERHADAGLESCVVFLSPQARGSATEDTKETAGNPEQAKALVEETINREKLVSTLKELSSSLKSVIVACCPAETVAQQYRLADNAEVTVVVYGRQRVFSSFAFPEGQLRQDGIDNVLKGVDAMLGALKK
jgi:hypothetical protein